MRNPLPSPSTFRLQNHRTITDTSPAIINAEDSSNATPTQQLVITTLNKSTIIITALAPPQPIETTFQNNQLKQASDDSTHLLIPEQSFVDTMNKYLSNCIICGTSGMTVEVINQNNLAAMIVIQYKDCNKQLSNLQNKCND